MHLLRWGVQSRATAQAPVAKGYGGSCQPVLPGPLGELWWGGVSHGPVSVTRWRCAVDSGRLLQPSPLRCAAVHHSVGWREKKEGTFPSMLREPSMTSDRCHGPTPGCHFPPPVTDHSKRLPPGFNKTWGIRKEGSVEREQGLEFLCEIATVVGNIDSDQIHQYGQVSPSVLINISMLANASLMLHLQWTCVFPPFGYGKCYICKASSWVVVLVFSVS